MHETEGPTVYGFIEEEELFKVTIDGTTLQFTKWITRPTEFVSFLNPLDVGHGKIVVFGIHKCTNPPLFETDVYVDMSLHFISTDDGTATCMDVTLDETTFD